jgi:hypothetical protein
MRQVFRKGWKLALRAIPIQLLAGGPPRRLRYASGFIINVAPTARLSMRVFTSKDATRISPRVRLHSVLVWLIRVVICIALLLIVAPLITGRLVDLYHYHFADPHRERAFLAAVSFFLTFSVIRILTHTIHSGEGPFHNIEVGGLHIHHMVWGISLLLILGYLGVVQVGTGMPGTSVWASRVMALLFGLASALTLDEFALWLNLKDVYWLPQGRESIDAVFLFGSLFVAGFLGGPFMHSLAREALHLLGRLG